MAVVYLNRLHLTIVTNDHLVDYMFKTDEKNVTFGITWAERGLMTVIYAGYSSR